MLNLRCVSDFFFLLNLLKDVLQSVHGALTLLGINLLLFPKLLQDLDIRNFHCLDAPAVVLDCFIAFLDQLLPGGGLLQSVDEDFLLDKEELYMVGPADCSCTVEVSVANDSFFQAEAVAFRNHVDHVLLRVCLVFRSSHLFAAGRRVI